MIFLGRFKILTEKMMRIRGLDLGHLTRNIRVISGPTSEISNPSYR